MPLAMAYGAWLAPFSEANSEIWLMAILCFFVMAAGYLWHLREMRKAREGFQLGLSRDLHDELGGVLSVLMMYSELAMHTDSQSERRSSLEKVRSSARRIHETIKGIIAGVHHSRARLGDWLMSLEKEAREASGTQGPAFLLHPGSRQVRSMVLRPEAYTQLDRLMREAIHNALKHSSASRISLRAFLSKDYLFLILEDNGKGFEPGQYNGGQGLSNMAFRARKIRGQLRITSSIGKGTRVRLSLPVHFIAVEP